ncbi:hypothetical protein Hamer_G006537 [Homarus americanus]|uniref:Uncharacterized protein n=1 Tax=Homarus americanus TaxID=6706 RepID=A0A8J5MM69_HOMAM|nr:hypothetical protein Hamer_G006537 [Homarus americanus]
MLKTILVACLVMAAVVVVTANPQHFNSQWYPGLQQGWGNNFFNHNPGYGYGGCRYWCRSFYNNNYYCCSSPNQQGGFF